MEIKGKLTRILPAQTGQGRNGEWKKQGFVIELEGTYPRRVHFQVWNNKVNVDALTIGAMVNVFFDPESREFQDKWYTDLTAWRVDMDTAAISPTSEAPSFPVSETFPEPNIGMDDQPKDDLPF